VADFVRRCRRARKEDVVATATALTTRSLGVALKRFVLFPSGAKAQIQAASIGTAEAVPLHKFSECVISGGGAKNRTLIAMLRGEVEPLGLTLRSSDEFGVPSAAKEAVAFALLAYETWHRRPSNIPSATGARGPAILGKISYAS
jgi:anhydro-N-acetylmuramic acid kinase